MPEPTSSTVVAIAVTATGLTVLGVATNLQPHILLAGFAGGLWALSYQAPAPLLRRVFATIGASIVAGYLAPVVSAILKAPLPATMTAEVIESAAAFLTGLTSQSVLGPAILRIAARKADEAGQ